MLMKNQTAKICVESEDFLQIIWKMFINSLTLRKSYISKLENGHADVQLSTLFRIFAGLGKRISLTVL